MQRRGAMRSYRLPPPGRFAFQHCPNIRSEGIGDAQQGAKRGVHRSAFEALPAFVVDAGAIGGFLLGKTQRRPRGGYSATGFAEHAGFVGAVATLSLLGTRCPGHFSGREYRLGSGANTVV